MDVAEKQVADPVIVVMIACNEHGAKGWACLVLQNNLQPFGG